MEVFVQEAKELLRRLAAGEISPVQCRDGLDDAASSVIPFVRPEQIQAFDAQFADFERDLNSRFSG